MDPNSPRLDDLQYRADHASLKSRLRNIVRIYRQALATGGFTAGPVPNLKIANVDLQRVHGIVNEIDSRRVFYEYFEDELPKDVLISINYTRDQIREATKGVWADSKQERYVQELQHTLNDFVTKVSRLDPFPENHHAEKFKEFEDLLGDLRLKVWTIIAHLKIKHGDVIQPKHLPEEVLDEVKRQKLP